MKFNTEWKNFKVLATGDGYKLEDYAGVTLLRPDPQIIWRAPFDLRSYKGLSAYYSRSATGGGEWSIVGKVPDEFYIDWRTLRFSLKLMGFKHTGVFPEQAVNWDRMIADIKGRCDTLPTIKGRGGTLPPAGDKVSPLQPPVSVLNLFAYTGGATLACASAGASVTHVDAAKAMCERAGLNARLSGLKEAPIRYIVDDCMKFCEKELRRGKRYDAVIMDPPSFGRGPNGEAWKLEDKLHDLVTLTAGLMSDKPLFFLINSYTTGLQPTVMKNVLDIAFKDKKHETDAYEIGLQTQDPNIILPCGCSAYARFK